MDAKSTRMRRPKRKLCYLASYENPPQPLNGLLSLMDVDKMFDDIDTSPQDELHSPSSLLNTFDCDANPEKRVTSPIPAEELDLGKDKQRSSNESPRPHMDAYLDIPFVAHHPAKTSSPIEQNDYVKSAEKLNNIETPSVTPSLFPLEDEEQDKDSPEPPLAQKHQSNEQVTQESDICQPMTPPSKIVVTMMSSLKKGAQSVRKETLQPEMPVEPATPNCSKSCKRPVKSSSRAGINMTAFLQKLKKAVQSKPPCSRKCELPVEVPAPPAEPEDDFFILEDDDMTFQFSIPSKTGPRRNPKQSKSSSSNKDSSDERGSNDIPVTKPHKQQVFEKASDKLGHEIIDIGAKKRRANQKVIKDAEADLGEASGANPEPQPSVDVKDQKKMKKKKNTKTGAKVPQADKDVPETETGMPPQTPKTKTPKSFQLKNSKYTKSKQENTKAKKFSKGKQKGLQVSNGDQEKAAAVQPNPSPGGMGHCDAEDFALPAETQRVDSDLDGKVKESKPVSDKGSSDDDHVLGKRKRKPTGQWWITNTRSSDDTDDQKDLVKKSKQTGKDSNTASPVRAEKTLKDNVLKRRHERETLLLNQGKGKKTKLKKNTKGNAREKKKETQEVVKPTEVEQKVINQGMDQEECSPLVSTHKDHSKNSEQVFQRVYHHGNKKQPVPSVLHRHPQEQLHEPEPAKRRRKPTGNWWMVTDNNVEPEESTPQSLPDVKRKPSKSKNKASKQKSSPEKMSAVETEDLPSKPAGGAPVPPLTLQPLFTPKTVKRSLDKFKDIFTSGVDTPAVMRSRDVEAHGPYITTHPAVETAADDHDTSTGAHSGQAVESKDTERKPLSHERLTDLHGESTSHVFKSGPTSLIELEEHEENGEAVIPSSRVQPMLSISDLCGPPLKPLILQPNDQVNLRAWFKSLWCTLAKNDAEITPEQFEWFFYQDRAMGILEDLNCSTICNGKILLGSYMKKPLWVDHSATTVFNLLSSSVHVTVDGRESSYGPGQSFMVHCGCAYSIKNVTAQPAVLYFTRMLAESSD